MADKLTLLELHMHAEDNEFESELELSSDIGELLRNRLGFGADEETATDEFDIDDSGNDSPSASGTTADGGDAVELGGESEETESAVVEIDRDSDLVDDEADDNEEEDSGGRSWGRTLLVVVLLVAVVYLARSYLGGDDFEDEFEEL